MDLWTKLLRRARKKYPPVKGDCRLKRESKERCRQNYMLHWIKTYKERYDKMYDQNRSIRQVERHANAT